MRKLITIYLFWTILSVPVRAQDLGSLCMKTIPECYNIDSLEKNLKASPFGSKAYLYNAICLMANLEDVFRFRPDYYLDQIDSLSLKYHCLFGTASVLYWRSLNKISVITNFYQIRKDLDLARVIYQDLNDKTGVFLVDRSKLLLEGIVINTITYLGDHQFAEQKDYEINAEHEIIDSSKPNLNYDNLNIKEKILFCKTKAMHFSDGIFRDTNNLKLYLSYQNQAYELIRQNPKYKIFERYFYINWAEVNFTNNNFSEAINYFKKYFASLHPMDTTLKIYLNLNIGMSYLKLKHYDSAFYFLKEGINISDFNKDKYSAFRKELFLNLYKIEATRGNYQAALNALQHSNVEKNKAQLNTNVINYLKLIYTQNLLKENKFLTAQKSKEQNELNLIINKSRFSLIMLIASLLLIVLFGYLIIKFYTNLNKLKTINQEINELNKARERFFSLVSHDLRGPIQSFELFMDNLKFLVSQKRFNETSVLIKESIKSVKSLSALLNNLLFWSLTQQKKLLIKNEIVDANKSFEELLPIYQTLLYQKNITVLKSFNAIQNVLIDKNRLAVINRNLLENAIKYCDDNGNIKIAISQQDSLLEIKISNTNASMNMEKLEKLKESFRTDKKTETGGNNFGLGLVLIRQCIETMKGSITTDWENGEIFFELKIPFS